MIVVGVGIAVTVGVIVVVVMDTMLGRFAGVVATGGHTPGEDIESPLRAVALCGSLVGFLAMTIYGALSKKLARNSNETRVGEMPDRAKCSIVSVGAAGMTGAVGMILVGAIGAISGWFKFAVTMSAAMRGALILLSLVTALGGFLVGLLGMSIGRFAGIRLSTVVGRSVGVVEQ